MEEGQKSGWVAIAFALAAATFANLGVWGAFSAVRGAERIARMWAEAGSGAYAVFAVSMFSALVLSVLLVVSGRVWRVPAFGPWTMIILPLATGQAMALHSKQQVLEAVATVSPLDKGIIMAAGVSECLAAVQFGCVAMFALGAGTALGWLIIGLGRSKEKGFDLLVSAAALSASAAAVLFGTKVAAWADALGAVAHVSPADKAVIVATALQQLSPSPAVFAIAVFPMLVAFALGLGLGPRTPPRIIDAVVCAALSFALGAGLWPTWVSAAKLAVPESQLPAGIEVPSVAQRGAEPMGQVLFGVNVKGEVLADRKLIPLADAHEEVDDRAARFLQRSGTDELAVLAIDARANARTMMLAIAQCEESGIRHLALAIQVPSPREPGLSPESLVLLDALWSPDWALPFEFEPTPTTTVLTVGHGSLTLPSGLSGHVGLRVGEDATVNDFAHAWSAAFEATGELPVLIKQ